MLSNPSIIKILRAALSPDSWSGGRIPLPPTAELEQLIRAETAANADLSSLLQLTGWAIPSQEVIQAVLGHMPANRVNALLGIGSGGAYLERLFQLAGLDVVATDIDTSQNGFYYRERCDGLYPIHRGLFQMSVNLMPAAPAIKKYPNRDIVICWPDMRMLEKTFRVLCNKRFVPAGTRLFLIHDLQETNPYPYLDPFSLKDRIPMPLHPGTGQRSHLNVLQRNR